MSRKLQRLTINRVRNLANVVLDDMGSVNIIYGANGSGKTSILESIHILGLGRSFRSSQMRPVIQHQQQECTVFGQIAESNGILPIGVTRRRNGEYEIRVAGEKLSTVAELAEQLPIQLINSESFKLLEGGPKVRREFLDWGVFHVEQSFHELWRRLQRCLKQRNSLLRRGKITVNELLVWDKELCSLSTQIDPIRESYFNEFVKVFNEVANRLIPDIENLCLDYQAGWDRDKPLADLLARDLTKDQQYGYTGIGAHKATISIRVEGVAAEQVLSRGQQKLVVCALKLAQGRLLNQLNQKICLYLVDDLPAELDTVNLQRMCMELSEIKGQLFFTSIDSEILLDYWQDYDDLRVFHVEHGLISSSAIPQLSNSKLSTGVPQTEQ